LIGFLLVLTGVVLPFLMVLHVLPSTFLLNFLAYGAAVSGLMIGLIGGAAMADVGRSHKSKNRYD
jgi:hypothetical protein